MQQITCKKKNNNKKPDSMDAPGGLTANTDGRGNRRKKQRLAHTEQPVFIIQYSTHTPLPQYDTTATLSAGLNNRTTKTTGLFYPSAWSTSLHTATRPFYYVCPVRAFKGFLRRQSALVRVE